MEREYVRFNSMKSADEFAQARENDGFDSVSVITNTPRPGLFEVRWGRIDTENARDYELRMIAKVYCEREDEARREFNRDCEVEGRRVAANQFAEAAGYSGRDAEIFRAGFCGSSAKFVNPRAEGRESIFRAGRIAGASRAGQRACRIEAVRARSILPAVEPLPFNRGTGLIANGEY